MGERLRTPDRRRRQPTTDATRRDPPRAATARTGNESGLVFTSSVGTLIEPRSLSRAVRPADRRVRRTSDQVSRSVAHLRLAVVGPGRAAASGDGSARALTDRDHDGPVFTRDAGGLAGRSQKV